MFIGEPTQVPAERNLSSATNADGLMDRAAFQEALRAVDILESAGVQGFQAQVVRVDDMVLGMVEQDLGEHAESEDGGSSDGGGVSHADSAVVSAQSQTNVVQVGAAASDDHAPPGCVTDANGGLASNIQSATTLASNEGPVASTPVVVLQQHPPVGTVGSAGPESIASTNDASNLEASTQDAGRLDSVGVDSPTGSVINTTPAAAALAAAAGGGGGGGGGATTAPKSNVSEESEGISLHKKCSHLAMRLTKWFFSEVTCWVLIIPYFIFLASSDDRPYSVWELLAPIAIAFLCARLIVGVIYAFVELISLSCLRLPSQVMLTFAALNGWPVSVIVWTACMPVLEFGPPWVEHRWDGISGMKEFWHLAVWLLVCAITRACLEGALHMTLNGLTVQHYETRIQAAVTTYAAIRKLFAIARAAEKAQAKHSRSSRKVRHNAVQSAAAEAVAKVDVEDLAIEGPSAIDRIQASLEVLGGPLQFGAGFRDAGSIEEARQRARRAFWSLVKAQGRARDDGLSRDKLLKWLGAGPKSAEASIFLMESLKEDDFVAVVDRAYKEQRFITASLTSFDVCNTLLRRFFILAWLVIMIFTGTFIFGVSFEDWILPILTLSVSMAWCISRILGDVIQGAIFVLWIRPFDIGDWVKLTSPGSPFKFDEMAVRSITLWRTQFVSSTGELLLIQNSVMHGMCISNLNRSSKPCLPIQIQVPAATPPGKVTELVDSVRTYIQERDTEFSDVSLTFSKIDYAQGHMNFDIWVTARCLHQEFGALYGSKTRLLLFIHAYMQASGIEYIKPMQPFKNVA